MKHYKFVLFLLAAVLSLMPLQAAFAAGSSEGVAIAAKRSAKEAPSVLAIAQEETTHTVTFIIEGFIRETKAIVVEDGQCVPCPPDTYSTPPNSDTDHVITFDGWYDGSGKKFNFDTPITQDIILYAQTSMRLTGFPGPPLGPTFVKITFISNGGTSVREDWCTAGDALTEPKAPTKTGYKFLGWYTKDGKKWDFSQSVTEPMTLYAHWEALPLVVQFNSAGGTPVGKQSLFAGDKIAKPADPTKFGYAFAGWYTKGGKRWNFSQTIVEDTALYARWISLREGVLPPTVDAGTSFIPVVLLGIGATGVLALRQRHLSQM